jgi:hypothetical protein
MRSEKCDEGPLVDTLKMDLVDGVWAFKANDRVIMRNDYNVLCLDMLGYVTVRNSGLAKWIRIL